MINNLEKKLRILIVEDEGLYRYKLEAYILVIGYELVASTDNSEDAEELILKEKPDIVIMDIKINGQLSGISLAKKLSYTTTKFLFVTSFNDKEKYESAKATSFIGFLVKPFDQITLQSVIEYSFTKNQETLQDESLKETIIEAPGGNSILVKHNAKFYQIFYSDIIYIEAKGKLSIVHTDERNLVSNASISKLLSKLPSDKFAQIHKSYIVNINQVTKVISKENEVYAGETVLPIGRVYKDVFFKRFIIV